MNVLDVKDRNVYIIGAGPGGLTSTAQLIAETHGHRGVAGEQIGWGNACSPPKAWLALPGPRLVVYGLRHPNIFTAMFNPTADVVVILTCAGVEDSRATAVYNMMAHHVLVCEATGRLQPERVVKAAYESVNSRALRDARLRLGITEDTLRRHGYWPGAK